MRNKSYSYIFPLVADFIPIDESFIKCIDNTYCYLEDDELFTIVFNNVNIDDFNDYIDELKDSYLFRGVEVSKHKTAIILEFPDEIKEVCDMFLQGKYSKIPGEYKKDILDFLYKRHSKDKIKIIEETLYKHNSLKERLEKSLQVPLSEDMEYSSPPSTNTETFDLEYFKNNIYE